MLSSTIYDFTATLPSKKNINLNDYEGKVLLIVNTASKCGLTPQFEGLEKLYKKYKEQGLVILGFPCDQFANQEYSDDNEIQNFCQINYGVTFPVFSKIDVNGNNTHPVFKYLKDELPGFLGIKAIKWNFTKFLIDRKGNPVKRFAPNEEPEKIEEYIKNLL
ncbi:MAG: glutathione peroxidase [Candidatus Sericytochromatia bacterium]